MKRERLIEARKNAGKTQAEVAAECEIDRTVYCRIETGAIKKIDYELALKIANAVQKSPEYIFLELNVNLEHKTPSEQAATLPKTG